MAQQGKPYNWLENKHIDIHEATNQTNKCNLAVSEKKNFRKITQEPPTHHNLLLAELEREPPIFPDENFMVYLRKTPQIYVDGTNQYKKINGKLIPITIAKNSIASKLTQKTEEVSATTPEEYLKFAKVFSEEAYQRMTPSRPYNHPILHNKTFIPKIGKVYPLSPDEQKATDNFIEENLWMGRIRPSSSPQASSFFFVGKTDSSLQPCQDYWYVNKHTIKNAYPLLLISNLIDKVKDTTIFTKFNIKSGYNNIQIKEGDQWKAAFITSKRLLEPTVMFFGLSNSPATFQRFMNDSFRK